MPRASPPQIATRVTAAILGSWAFVLGFVSIGITLLARLGMAYSNAQTLMYLVGGVVLLAAFLWSFAAAKVGHVWAVLGVGAVLMTGASWWLARAFN